MSRNSSKKKFLLAISAIVMFAAIAFPQQVITTKSQASTQNSRTTLLTANSVFTGGVESSQGWQSITVMIFTDQNSAAGGLAINQGRDPAHMDVSDTFTVTANTVFVQSVQLVAEYFQIIYTNGNVDETLLRLDTVKWTIKNPLPRTLTASGNLRAAIVENTAGPAAGMTPTAGTLAATTTAAVLGANTPCKTVLVQCDPANAGNCVIGDGSSQVITLTVGQSAVFPVSNINLLKAKMASGTVCGTCNVQFISFN